MLATTTTATAAKVMTALPIAILRGMTGVTSLLNFVNSEYKAERGRKEADSLRLRRGISFRLHKASLRKP